jgi:hypothetical protein
MRFRWLLAMAILGTLVFHPALAQAAQPTLKQQILPLECVFETVNDGLGTIHYLTPTECGVVLPPASSGSQTNSSVTPQSTPVSRPLKNSFIGRGTYIGSIVPPNSKSNPGAHPDENVTNGSGTILLNSISDSLSGNGYLVTIHPGNVLFYRPSDQPGAKVRSLSIVAIGSGSVTFYTQPFDENLTINLGKTLTYDRLLDGNPALSISVISTSSQDTATLRIHLLQPAQNYGRQTAAGLQLVLLGLIFVGLFSLRVHLRRFSSKRQ